MLKNYSAAAKNRNYTTKGRKLLAKRAKRVAAEGRHPCLGKHWTINKEALAARSKKPGNHTGYTHSEETKAKISASRVKQFKEDPKFLKAAIRGGVNSKLKQGLKRFKPTSIERKVYKYLKKQDIVFVKQKLIKNRFFVDAYIPSLKLAIEVDGKYWHSLPRAIIKDRLENKLLKKWKYSLLRIPEEAVNDGSFRRLIKEKMKHV